MLCDTYIDYMWLHKMSDGFGLSTIVERQNRVSSMVPRGTRWWLSRPVAYHHCEGAKLPNNLRVDKLWLLL